MWSGLAAKSVTGTWWARNVPSICWPSTTFGPVQPFGRAQHDHRPLGRADHCRFERASSWIAAISSSAQSSAAAISWWTAAGSSPLTNTGAWP